MKPLDYLDQRANDNWLIGYDSQVFFNAVQQMLQDLHQAQTNSPHTILLAERDPLKFLASFMAACSANCRIVLANPDWAESEWQQVIELVQPDLVWSERVGDRSQRIDKSTDRKTPFILHPSSFIPSSPLILIPTGGSSGAIRFAIHTWETLIASVEGFQQYFERRQIHSFCVLPLYHVSGLMQFLRSFTSGGNLVVQPFKAVAAKELAPVNPEDFFLSLVPTQLHRLFASPTHFTPWLSRFHTVLLGGAPAGSDLLETARQHGIRLAPTYGMTETASQIATLKPDDFLAGRTGYSQLPHACITIRSPSGEVLAAHQTGNITITAKSLALGYYPTPNTRHPTPHSPQKFQPDDLGFLDADGYLHIVGRQGDKIITGGENVFPAEVEAAIRSTALVQDVCVVGVDDRQWGQIITAVYVPNQGAVASQVQAALSTKLSKFKQPKQWIAVEQLPRNDQGKINQQQLKALINLAQAPIAATNESSL